LYSLTQSKGVRGAAGDPIPTVWKALEDVGIVFRRGQLVLIAAGPGTAKSAFTLTMALQSKVPSLLFSADSDAFTQLTRAIALLNDMLMSDSAAMVLSDRLTPEVSESLKEIPLRIDYDASPTVDQIEQIVESYWELFGEYPSIVVVDNITNVVNDNSDGDPFTGLEGLMDYLHSMARETGSCVIGLHHVTGDYNNGDKPIPLNGVKGQIARVPEMVLTIHKVILDDEESILRVSPVKNRGGKPDPTGQTYAELSFVGNRMSIRDVDLNQDQSADWEDERRMLEEQ
jgi:hypothetical protein